MSSAIIDVKNLTHYLELIAKEKRLILINIGLKTCAPCFKLSMILEQMSLKYSHLLLILKIDINVDFKLPLDEQISRLFSIKQLPTIVFIKDGSLQHGNEFQIDGYDLSKLEIALVKLTDVKFDLQYVN